MKRARNEFVQMSVTNYLKRRHYSNTEIDVTQKSRDRKTIQTLNELTLNGIEQGEASLGNTISYSSVSGDVTACDQQFVRLKNMLQASSGSNKAELQELIYPLFVHIFLELLCNGHKTPAHKFFGRHQSNFENQRDKQKFLDTLRSVHSKDEVLSTSSITAFRENKYCISLSPEATQYLLNHLRAEDNMVLMQIFNKHIQIKGPDHCSIELQSEQERQECPQTCPPFTPENKVITNDLTMTSLRKCIQRVRDGPPCLTSMCFYTFINAYQGLCSCTVSQDRRLLCGGFEDSVIRLWSLTPHLLTAHSTEYNISQIKVAGDYIEEHESSTKIHEMVSLRGHSGSIYGTCFTPDSQFLLTASEDKTVRLWDLETQTNRVCYTGHDYAVWGVDVSTLGCYFASCSMDKTAKLWSIDRVFPLRCFVGHTTDVDCVKFHPNGNYIATGSSDKTVRLWNTQEARSVRLFHGHRGTIYALAFSPNGQYLASAGEDRRIKIWDLGTGKMMKELKGHTDTVYNLSFNCDNTLLASGGLDCMVRVWDVRKGVGTTPSPSSSSGTDASTTSHEMLGAFPTKSTTVHCLSYTKNNLLLAAGAL